MLLKITILNLIFFFIIKKFFFNKAILFYNIYDVPSARKMHTKKTSLIGGPILLFFLIINIFLFSIATDFNEILLFLKIYNLKLFLFFLFFIIIVFLIGIYDDKFNLNNLNKIFFLFFIFFLYFYVRDDLTVKSLYFSKDIFITINKISLFFTTLSVLVLLVIMNLYDGIDLQSGIFYFFIYLFLFLLTKNFYYIIFLFPILFFLFFNFKKKCFLGDSGSNLYALILGINFLNIYNEEESKIFFSQILILFFIPLIDAFRLFFFRVLKHGNPLKADKIHFHHLLINKFGFLKTISITSLFVLISVTGVLFKFNILLLFLINLFLYFFFINLIKNS